LSLDIQKIRADFPVLGVQVHGKPLVYLDNGATTQKPRVVIDTLSELMLKENSSIHRGVHYLSEQMTEHYEEARRTVQQHINAELAQEIVFTSGTTGSINTLAFSFGEMHVHEGDEVVVSGMEHHSNIVPWQMLCARKKANLKVIPVTPAGELDMEAYRSLLNSRVKIVAVTHVSNALGTINPVKEIIRLAHEKDIPVMLDGAQAIQHEKVDVRELGCDFYVFSGHKVYGPTGIGVLYGHYQWLKDLPPYQGGGDMVDRVTFEHTTYNDLPFRFEAGTTNYLGAIGLGVALQYLQEIGIADIARHERALLDYATQELSSIEGLRIYGNSQEKISILSFLVGDIHPYDMGMILDKMGIATRTGTHCAQPLMDYFGIPGTLRASMVFYNTAEEVDKLVAGVRRAAMMLG
jgi:cysteine desulfurase / selenocysteine lyase